MSGFDTAIRAGLRFKRHSEALVADEKRRKKKKRARENKKEDAGPTVVVLPPVLAEDSQVRAAATAIEAGKDPAEALSSQQKKLTETQCSPETGDASPNGAESDKTKGKSTSDDRSASLEPSLPKEAEEVEALLSETNPHWTQAERAFFLARKAREAERVKKQLQLTHRQRMEKLNQHLASLSEHFDQPRVGPG